MKDWWKRYRYRRAMAFLRRELAFMGICDLTDEEIEEAMVTIGKAIRVSGITGEEATNAIRTMEQAAMKMPVE